MKKSFTILLHTSKTMRPLEAEGLGARQDPVFLEATHKLAESLKDLSIEQVQTFMKLSATKAQEVHALIARYGSTIAGRPAIDSFLGDIYSGLRVQTFSAADRQYANKHLYILSGLYGVLRALDTIQPYRLEMGYKLPDIPSMYVHWGDAIAQQIPKDEPIINLSAVEYTKAVFPYYKNTPDTPLIITPKFLTVSPKTGEPAFVTVHAKIARGAYARWLIQTQVSDIKKLKDFKDLGYEYDAALSTQTEPVFVTKTFGGLGLSVRLSY